MSSDEASEITEYGEKKSASSTIKAVADDPVPLASVLPVWM